MAEWIGGYGDNLDVQEMVQRKERLLQIIVSERAPDPNTRDDILQEARIAVWKAMSKPHDSDAYIHTAVRRRVDDVRDRQTWTGHTRVHGQPTDPLRRADTDSLDRLMDVGLMTAASAVLDGIELAYHQGELFEAIGSLPANYREYVILRFWGGLSDPEIAAKVGLSKATLQRWWTDARSTLRVRLAHLAGV